MHQEEWLSFKDICLGKSPFFRSKKKKTAKDRYFMFYFLKNTALNGEYRVFPRKKDLLNSDMP